MNTAAAVVGPPLATSLFGFFVGPAAPAVLPGAPFFIGSLLFLAALLLARRTLAVPPQTAPLRPSLALT